MWAAVAATPVRVARTAATVVLTAAAGIPAADPTMMDPAAATEAAEVPAIPMAADPAEMEQVADQTVVDQTAAVQTAADQTEVDQTAAVQTAADLAVNPEVVLKGAAWTVVLAELSVKRSVECWPYGRCGGGGVASPSERHHQ